MTLVHDLLVPWAIICMSFVIMSWTMCQLSSARPERAQLVPFRWWRWVLSRVLIAVGMLARIIATISPESIAPETATILTLSGIVLWLASRRRREQPA